MNHMQISPSLVSDLGLPAYMCVAVWRCECFVVHVVLARQVLRLTHLQEWARTCYSLLLLSDTLPDWD